MSEQKKVAIVGKSPAEIFEFMKQLNKEHSVTLITPKAPTHYVRARADRYTPQPLECPACRAGVPMVQALLPGEKALRLQRAAMLGIRYGLDKNRLMDYVTATRGYEAAIRRPRSKKRRIQRKWAKRVSARYAATHVFKLEQGTLELSRSSQRLNSKIKAAYAALEQITTRTGRRLSFGVGYEVRTLAEPLPEPHLVAERADLHTAVAEWMERQGVFAHRTDTQRTRAAVGRSSTGSARKGEKVMSDGRQSKVKVDRSPQVVRRRFLAIQVCVPGSWNNTRIKDFADAAEPCGTQNGWHVYEEGAEGLQGTPARVPCADRKGFVHVVLGA